MSKNIIVKKDLNLKAVTRIAPSPTAAFLHIGNCRTMLYNYFLAKKTGGKFLVRLEDTDRGRYTPEFIPYFKETLKWLGITPDESPWNPNPAIGSYVQSERDYSQKVNYLLDKGLAYYAFDTNEDLDAARKENPNFKYDHTSRMLMKNSFTMSKDDVDALIRDGKQYVIRFAVEPNIEITFDDLVRGEITINSSTLDDKVLIKSDGIASYHLANTSDDHDMGVTYVIRGEEWIVSTPFHILLYKAFGWDFPNFAHLPLIMNPDGKGKLSKRNADKYGIPIAPLSFMNAGVEVKGWKENGYSAEAFINSLSLMGWHPEGDVDILSMDDLIDSFSIDRVVKHGAKFSMEKSRWINGEWVKSMPYNDVKDFLSNHFDLRTFPDYKLEKIVDICKERSHFLHDMLPVASIFFTSFSKKVDDENYRLVFDGFVNTHNNIDYWKAENIKQHIYALCNSVGLKMGKIMPGLRQSLTGGVAGPDLMTTMEIIGRDESIKRIVKSFTK